MPAAISLTIGGTDRSRSRSTISGATVAAATAIARSV
jgi:hypothetical protein